MAKLKDLILEVKSLEGQILALKSKYDKAKLKIQEIFDEKDLKRYDVDSSEDGKGSGLYAIKVERVTIDYNADELKEKFDKELFNEMTTKSYSIADFQLLKKLMKDAGIEVEDFKKCINVSVVPNKAAIQQLYAVGDITKKDLKGCYTATITKSIQIKQKKGDKD